MHMFIGFTGVSHVTFNLNFYRTNKLYAFKSLSKSTKSYHLYIYQSNSKILGLNNQQSCSKTVLSEWEVFLSFLDLGDLLGLLVHAQSGSEGSGKLGSQELSSSG